MSEPFIRVYCADMRADPKIAELNRRYEGGAYYLIQLWDIAKNGPGEPDELIGPDGHPLTASAISRIVGFGDWTDNPQPGGQPTWQPWTYQRCNAYLNTLGNLGLSSRSTSGAIRFPTLKRRQGIDGTNAARQAKFRAKSNGTAPPQSNAAVTPPSNAPVTAYRRARAPGPEPEPEGPPKEGGEGVAREPSRPPGLLAIFTPPGDEPL